MRWMLLLVFAISQRAEGDVDFRFDWTNFQECPAKSPSPPPSFLGLIDVAVLEDCAQSIASNMCKAFICLFQHCIGNAREMMGCSGSKVNHAFDRLDSPTV